MKYRSALIILISGLMTVPNAFAQKQAEILKSPDGKIKVSVNASGASLTYAVELGSKMIVNPSALGMELQNNIHIGEQTKLIRTSVRTYSGSWKNPLGKFSIVADHFNELKLDLQEADQRHTHFSVIFRAYNDGIAFRYLLPKQTGLDTIRLSAEKTTFNFTGDFESYVGHHANNSYRGSQEWEFLSEKLSNLKPDSVIGLPLLVKTPAAWVAVAEADLLDWAGMWLTRQDITSEKGTLSLVSRLAPHLNKPGLVTTANTRNSPWRVLMIGKKPGDLIESNIILNLSTPSKITNTEWIKPGLMAWDHWWSGGVWMNTESVKEYIQLAADMGWPYQLIDWQWYGKFNSKESDITKINPALDLDEVIRFAKEKHVRLWVWLYWKDVDRNDAYKKAFELFEKRGFAGIKIDFMDRDDQEMVNWYEKIASEAAAHHLMVDFHGAYKPTGLERTYPNQVTREGILGNEYNRWSSRVTSKHKLTLLFTRLLTGPADFTPGGFINRQPYQFKPDSMTAEVQGTRAAELALFVLYNSPVMVACDLPGHYLGQPGADFLKVVPTVWDKTKVLDAGVGKFIVEARKKGREWFLGGLADDTARSLIVNLSFLGKGSYKVRIWKDAADSGTNAEHLDITEKVVTAKDKLTLPMVKNGGFVARFTKRKGL